jgi:uncharacterized membrane protein YphA (DoxX/SURF4 family)
LNLGIACQGPAKSRIMQQIVAQGRFFFAIALMASGTEQLICARSALPVRYIIPWAPGNSFLAYVVGIVLLTAGLSIAIYRKARLSALILGALFLACAAAIWVPKAVASPLSGSIRTVLFETLAFGASAFTLAGLLPAEERLSGRWGSAVNGLIKSGPYLFAASSVVFGVDYFLFLDSVASLVPAWIPGSGLFWACLTGAVFISAGICITTGWMARWGAFWLGMMFLLWFLILHSRRVVRACLSHDQNTPNELSSAFIALGMCGASWIVAWNSLQCRARTFLDQSPL